MNNKGKLTFTGILVIILILYGSFAAVQIITAKLTEDEISKKVKDRLGRERRFSLTDSEAEDFIYEVLSTQKGIIFGENEEDSISVTIDLDNKTIHYSFDYGIETDLIFFKKLRRIRVDDSIRSYN
jgi:hypothetical protein